MFKPFGSTTPWADPVWYSGRPSPYYKESHVKLRDFVRKWTDENVAGKSDDWEAAGKVPDDIYKNCAQDGLIVPISAGNRIPKEWAHYPIAAAIKAEDWDGFHDFILWDELFRGAPSLSSVFIGLTRILPELLTGKKRICLAITEPSAGSDVRNIITVAEKTHDGKHYIVNGEKKISCNHIVLSLYALADSSDLDHKRHVFGLFYVRTGGSGAGGLSMLLIPRTEGLRTRKIEVGAGGLSATTYVIFEKVKVPVSYLVGEEGCGFRYTMNNFNHERLWICLQGLRGVRICLEDAMAWCTKREAFGKTLIEQPVVRHRFGHVWRAKLMACRLGSRVRYTS
ncbi:Acyl-dehydrogenase apdG [Hyphodiscus hymeniophilus]|uniref:Acyl-dehydrogenase apdG n=1 Tax=Hyphodiscus hymeniophilus TaxID=353542 RepID=A0A9P7B0X7_9HELO|nr:Acyl-dehydrogenase apdG [Hyphodiscus hymeniophilus]